jgi:hypothetical protein
VAGFYEHGNKSSVSTKEEEEEEEEEEFLRQLTDHEPLNENLELWTHLF